MLLLWYDAAMGIAHNIQSNIGFPALIISSAAINEFIQIISFKIFELTNAYWYVDIFIIAILVLSNIKKVSVQLSSCIIILCIFMHAVMTFVKKKQKNGVW